ncbi:hypothetical protein, partial [Burkholderia cenocepacia]|uniref:hypothetical protein n=1 Tax=Burkholderia cenocepacia TaxID=95486 RepID=UPI001E530A4B
MNITAMATSARLTGRRMVSERWAGQLKAMARIMRIATNGMSRVFIRGFFFARPSKNLDIPAVVSPRE